MGAGDEGTGLIHEYLSTGCLHGRHAYCQKKDGKTGGPAQCKFCKAPCTCDCHLRYVCECHPRSYWQWDEFSWFRRPLGDEFVIIEAQPTSADAAHHHGQLRVQGE